MIEGLKEVNESGVIALQAERTAGAKALKNPPSDAPANGVQ